MVVRLWTESSHDTRLRARITQTLDATGNERSLAVVASAEDICEAVKTWVDAFERQPAHGHATDTAGDTEQPR